MSGLEPPNGTRDRPASVLPYAWKKAASRTLAFDCGTLKNSMPRRERERGREKERGGRCLEVWLGRANTICRRRAGADSPQRPCNRQTDRQRPIQEHAALARQAGGDRTWSILAAAWVRVGQGGSARVRVGRGGSGWVSVSQGGSAWVRVGQCESGWVSAGQGGSARVSAGQRGSGWDKKDVRGLSGKSGAESQHYRRVTRHLPPSGHLSPYTVCPKKVSPLTFCNNNRKSAPI